MATTIYFVTENYLKVNTPITANVNITEVLPLVKGAADMWTQSTLGTYFYNDLLVKYNDQTLNPDEETLVALMQPSIAWRAAADAVIELSFQLKNKGIQTQSGDNSAAAESKMVQFMNRHYAQKAEFYEQKMWEYLVKNRNLYPEFISPLNHNSTCLNSCRNGRNNFNSQILFS
jgi:hypothetical protein